jgi:transcriptional regulator with PAS, ATPase and Fis domain
MSPALQAKLLRVLQEREIERVGDSHTIKIDVRVIAATHSDLAKMVAEGSFREDLYYRLNVIPVKLPPLRERRDDIPLLVQHFLQRFTSDAGRGPLTMSQEGMRRLMAYHWPGNVRQLENVVERSIAFSQGRPQVEVQDLSSEAYSNQPPPNALTDISFPDEGLDFDEYIWRIERALIKQALDRTSGNKRQAAKLLSLKRTTLVEKLKRLHPLD